jgi:hypothetical protein
MSIFSRQIEPFCPNAATSACLLHLFRVLHSAERTHDITYTSRGHQPTMDYESVGNQFTVAECQDIDRKVGPIRDGRGDRSRERLQAEASLGWVLHGRTSEFSCDPRSDCKRHIVAVWRERMEPYRLFTGSHQFPPLHYCIQQRRLANIGSPCRGLACLSDGVLGG